MACDTIPIRFVKTWRQYPAGSVISPPAAVAELYLRDGRAERVEPAGTSTRKRKRRRRPAGGDA